MWHWSAAAPPNHWRRRERMCAWASPEQAGEAHAHIRSRLRQWFGGAAADQCHILYGGSVKPDNIRELKALPDVDGALVGGASLEIRSFFEIVTRARAAVV